MVYNVIPSTISDVPKIKRIRHDQGSSAVHTRVHTNRDCMKRLKKVCKSIASKHLEGYLFYA